MERDPENVKSVAVLAKLYVKLVMEVEIAKHAMDQVN